MNIRGAGLLHPLHTVMSGLWMLWPLPGTVRTSRSNLSSNQAEGVGGAQAARVVWSRKRKAH